MTSVCKVSMNTCSKNHTIRVSLRDDGDLDVEIDTDCPHVKEYAEKLLRITMDDASSFAGSRIVDPDIRASLSAPCLVPNAVFDAAWMELGMLSKNLCRKVHSNELILDCDDE